MKNYFKTILLLAAVFSLFCFSGCGTNKGKNESEVLADVKNQDSFISEYNLKIRSSSVIKRQTNIDQKTDYVWVSLKADNADFSYSAEYYME